MAIRIRDPGFGAFLIPDPGSGMEKFGSGMRGSATLVKTAKIWIQFPEKN
jgi:hypothetical protein